MYERTTEVFEVQLRVQRRQPHGHRRIVRMLRRRPARGGTNRHRIFDDDVSRRRTFRPIA